MNKCIHIVCFILFFGLSGCNSSSGGSGNNNADTTIADPVVVSDVPTEESAESSVSEPVETDADSMPAETPVSVERLATTEIVADETFDFKTDRTLSFEMVHTPSAYGKVVFYTGFDYHNEESDIYVPDYMAKVSDHLVSEGSVHQVMVPASQEFLIVEWLPMDNMSLDQAIRINLDKDGHYYIIF